MRMSVRGVRCLSRVLTILLLGALCAGCHTQVAIRPAELPKLDPRFRDPAAGPSAQPVGHSNRAVETADGKLIEVDGDNEVWMTLQSGQMLLFEPPLTVQEDGSAFVIRSSNRAQKKIERSDIREVTVSQRDVGSSVAAGVLGGLTAVGLMVYLLVSVAN